MTFVSVADACRRLGIDAKTLRRWLADAQLPLHSHPCDGRKKGVSSEHLELLARLHHRSLTPLPSEPSEPSALELPPLPATLLALPEQMGALQAQLSALQQQVAALTHLLQQHTQPPACPAAPVQQAKKTKRPPPAPRSHPAASAVAQPPRKPAHVIPRVESGPDGRYVVICPKQGLLAFEPDSPAWFAWLARQSSFRFVGRCGHLTAHHEWRVPRGAWRAHRQIRNHTYTLRLAPTHDLTMAVLEQAAEALQAHLT
jgi:transposase-like protein